MRAWRRAINEPWAIEQEALQTILAVAALDKLERLEVDLEAVAAQIGKPLGNSRVTVVRDGVAAIGIVGPIFRRANLFTQISGAVSVDELAADLRQALEDPAVRAVVLEIDSPGGEVHGIAELAGMIRQASGKKPLTAYTGGVCASAAYWLASAAGEVVAGSTALLGSIGIVAAFSTERDPHQLEFVSTSAPRKRPAVHSSQGRAEIQHLLDATEQVFVADVARYRGVSRKTVLSDFGQGGMFVGAAAVRAGLADRLGSFEGCLAELAAGRRPEPKNAGGLRKLVAGT